MCVCVCVCACVCRDDWGRTVLHWAAAVGLPQAIEPVTAVAARERTAQLEAYQAAGTRAHYTNNHSAV